MSSVFILPLARFKTFAFEENSFSQQICQWTARSQESGQEGNTRLTTTRPAEASLARHVVGCQYELGSRIFPKNDWVILLTCAQEPVYIDLQMKVILLMPPLSFRGSPSHSRGSGTDLPQSLRRGISKGQKGRLRNNEHLSNQ